jgi:type VII secretion protein EccB
MPSRQDQLHSYQFMVQRVVAALVMRETDPPQSPLRRTAGAALASVLVAAIALGAAAVYGAVVGGAGTEWKDNPVVIVERESGARYVYRDNALHLVLNYASALLILRQESPRTVLVSRKSLEGVRRGAPYGLPDAPDSLPGAGRLSTEPWSVCSMPPETSASSTVRSALLVGADLADNGSPLGDRGVLARHPDGTLHLIWHNRRFQIRDRNLVLPALTWTSQPPVPVSPALLNALPAGADLAPLRLPGQGGPSQRVPGARIGQVYLVESQSGGQQYVVARRDGVAGLTRLQASLLLVETGQNTPARMPLSQFAGIPKLSDLIPAPDMAPPETAPTLASPDPKKGICGQVADDSGIREVRVDAEVPDVGTAVRTRSRSEEGAPLADYVLVPPGRGAVVESAAAPGATGGTVSVVTDLGRAYAVSGPDALKWLGYGQVTPKRLPASVVALVPAGRTLDPDAAVAPLTQD